MEIKNKSKESSHPDDDLVPVNFGLGINNIDDEEELAQGSARIAKNVDITRSGWPRRRKGYTNRLALTNGHSLFSHKDTNLIVNAGVLNSLNTEDMTLSPLVGVLAPLSYAEVLDTIYFTDNTIMGRILPDGSYKPAWTDNPPGNPTVASTSTGSLQPGKYMVSITYVDDTGEESGTDISVPVELTANGGISLTEIPQDSSATATRIYLTSTGGEIFYHQLDLPMGLTTHTITTFKTGKQLDTQFAEPMPAGSALCYHYGRLYVGINGYIYYSEALRPGLTRLMDNYFPQVGGEIKIIMSHTTGLFVVADKTYFIAGTNPENMKLDMVFPHTGAKGTGIYISATDVNVEEAGDVPCWFSEKGLVAGLSGGLIKAFTDKQLSVGSYEKGATLYREEEGIRSVVTSVQGGNVAKLQSTDSVSFEVRRNGIVIPP